MDTVMEKKIAQGFVYKNKRDRFLFELQKQDRLKPICKLPVITDDSIKLMYSNRLPSPKELIRTMQAYGVKDKCYVLSEYGNEGYDSVYLQILKRKGNVSIVSLVICIIIEFLFAILLLS